MNSIQCDSWGKSYKIVMAKMRSSGPPCETLDKNFLMLVIGTLFPDRICNYPKIRGDKSEDYPAVSEEEAGV